MNAAQPPLGDADLAAVGAVLAEPARATVLLADADGRALPAIVLAGEAGVTAPTASHHLAGLVDASDLRRWGARFRLIDQATTSPARHEFQTALLLRTHLISLLKASTAGRAVSRRDLSALAAAVADARAHGTLTTAADGAPSPGRGTGTRSPPSGGRSRPPDSTCCPGRTPTRSASATAPAAAGSISTHPRTAAAAGAPCADAATGPRHAVGELRDDRSEASASSRRSRLIRASHKGVS